jgi:hypothetical protein
MRVTAPLIPDQNELRYAYEHVSRCYDTARRLVFDLHCDDHGRPVAAPLTAVERRVLGDLRDAEAELRRLRQSWSASVA